MLAFVESIPAVYEEMLHLQVLSESFPYLMQKK
jgi:hypothetical protein